MGDKAEFERQLMALDRERLAELLDATVGMYQEFFEVHGYSKAAARAAAVNEMFEGLEAAIELDDHGEL